MMQFKKTYILPAIAILLLGAILGVELESAFSDKDTYAQLRKLEKAFVIINRQYVEPVQSKQVAERGIKGMLNELDPHSSYISAEEVKEVQESYQGSFGGIGIWFEVVNDTAQVISPITDGPSEKVGVMAGDRIVAIEDSSAIGIGAEGIQNRLKGPIGTEVEMTVRRPGMDKRLSFTITRDEIPLYSIDAAYMLNDRTGYIKVNRFAMTTHEEFLDSLRVLEGKGMQRLVLDLRGNPGGIMRSAIKMADELLAGGHTIVKTRGREANMNHQFGATDGDTFEQKPVIVLVNGNSASASEIVSGALQDNDRALIVGQRTFGKALIQKQFELPDGSMLQMTVGRYYTPVGRLIQTPYKDGNLKNYYKQKFENYDEATFHPSEYKESIPDSMMYQTVHGRTVFGGGGIYPDVVVQPDTTGILRAVIGNGLDQLFIRDWFLKHEQTMRNQWANRRQAFIDQYTVAPATVDSFWTFATEKGLTLTDDPATVDPKEGVYLRAKAQQQNDRLKTYLKARMAGRLYGGRAAVPILNKVDQDLQQALSMWDQAQSLAAYHNGSKAAAGVRNGDR